MKKTSKPSVTVIVPAYNAAAHIEPCLQSILSNNDHPMEVLVINDGSTDATKKVVSDLAKTDTRLRLINQRNRGVSAARNRGIHLIKTDYFMFVDSDDVIHRDSISLHVATALQTNADIVCSKYNKTQLVPTKPEAGVRTVDSSDATKSLLYDKFIKSVPTAKLYKTSIFKSLEFDTSLQVGEDTEYVFRCLMASKRVALLDAELYLYIQRPGSAMQRPFTKQRFDSYRSAQKMYDTKRLTSSIKQAAKVKLFTEAFSIATLLHASGKTQKYPSIRRQCTSTITKLSRDVLLDQQANFGQRLYAFMASISVPLAIRVSSIRRKVLESRKPHRAKARKKTRALIKYYANDNLGDDLFVDILAKRYTNEMTIVKKYGTRYEPKRANIHIYSNKFVIMFHKIIGKLLGVADVTVLRQAKKHDLLIYIGGSIFIQNTDERAWKKHLRFYRQLKLPFYVVGANIGPYHSARFLDEVRETLARAKDVCLRDRASYELVKDITNTRLATDIAYVLEKKRYQRKKTNLAVVSVIDCSERFDRATAQAYQQNIIALTKKLLDEKYKVVYMSFCKNEGDERAIDDILDMMSSAVRSRIRVHAYDGNLDESLRLLSSAKVVVGTRFHAIILGMVFGCKVIPLAYSDKTTNILQDIGFSAPVYDIRSEEPINVSQLDIASLPIMNITAQKKLAAEQFQELDKVLVRRRTL
ncbi:hypothetical protein CR983_00065 [Candidatus Saccharibacteria bacterium]|nr:MAG: hypothetical protein CR983_00065 [Candidatus Saccharibacteria bacterium]